MLKRIPDNCSLLYSDLLQKTLDSSTLLLSGGSFVSKKIGGAKYWYHQTKSPSGTVQKYIGKETAALLKQIESGKRDAALNRPIIEERRRLVAMLGVGGAFLEKGRPAKIISKMADVGLFSAGGVLVGSFAFACYGNMLGVTLNKNLMRTEDMDFSVERVLDVGFHRSIPDDLQSIESTLKPPKQINPATQPFDLIAADGFKVEFLTTKVSPTDRAAVHIERFSLYAQPLDYMDYLLDQAQSAVVLYGAGIPIMVPDPARFALHKLAISQLRPPSFQTKALKDIEQASSLLEILLEDNPGSLILASDALGSRDDLMMQLVKKGINQLSNEVQNAFLEAVSFPDVTWDATLGRPSRK